MGWTFRGMALAALILLVWAVPAQADDDKELFEFADSRITESSGLAVSPTHPGIVYTHNDSAAAAVFYAVDGSTGRTKAAYTITNAEARDWEGMAAYRDQAGRGVLFFGDIGDNLDGAWSDISVYEVAEPTRLRGGSLEAVRYRFRYADGARNAEGLMVDPRTGRLYVVTKEFDGLIYAAPKQLRTDRVNVLKRVGSAPTMATDAAFAPDGSSFVVRTYFSATLYRKVDDEISGVGMPMLRQAESITYSADGKSLLTGSEGEHSPVVRVPLPEAAVPSPSPTPKPSKASPAALPVASESEGPDAGFMIVLWLGVAVGAIGIIIGVARWAGR
ncbi:hypothetical protein [Herbidospora mongoliensis]|uniref:hypothetical protein n=1 Tax=Herbidospora mongoliensis TaxID=688067 RepID=UPI000A02976C|nr:hypothetical protein [Herbidospora mongoliensis]